MELTLHTEFPAHLETEWNALLDETATHVPFLRHEYLQLWWQTRGGGEWQNGELALVTARRDGKLAAAAPLFYTPDHQGQAALLLLGSIEISDYLDLLVRPPDLPVFLDALLPFLQSSRLPPFASLDLYNILDHSPTLAALKTAAERHGWEPRLQKLQHSPYIPLPGDWDQYLAGIDKKQRHEIRRKLRRIQEAPLPVRWYMVSNEATLDAEIEDFLRLMRNDPVKDAFLSPQMEEHMRMTARCAFERGCLNLSFLEIGGEKAAAYLSFDYLNRLWIYNSGINFKKFGEYSPGWVLLAYLLRWANEPDRAVRALRARKPARGVRFYARRRGLQISFRRCRSFCDAGNLDPFLILLRNAPDVEPTISGAQEHQFSVRRKTHPGVRGGVFHFLQQLPTVGVPQ